MARKDIPEDTLNLMINYLSGNASPAETTALERWVLADPEQKAAFVSFKKTWMMASLNAKPELNVNQEWDQLSKAISTEAKTVKLAPRKTSRRSWLSIAAAFLVLTTASIWLYQSFGTGQSALVFATENNPQNNQLPDGSTIFLNQYSSISYALADDGNQRNIDLQGDAFFDVKRDETKPFVIQAGEATIEVLGTSFYVDARNADENIDVIVKSGSVSVSYGTEKVVLSAGEKANWNKDKNALIASENNDPNYLSFSEQKLVFENTSLEQVVFALNRQYHSNIKIADSILKNCPLTATYTNKSLESILTILQATLNIEIDREEMVILLKGDGC